MGKSKKGITTDGVFRKIKNMMYYNELAPGQKLLYQDLAKRLNTSITPVIQALKRLEYSNLVTYKRNRGYFMGEITETEVKELYLAREALETYIIPLIVSNLNIKKLNAIRKYFREYNDLSQDRRLLILKDAQFHLKIAEFSHNRVIFRLLNEIFDELSLKYRPEYMSDERIKEAIQEHRRILIALEKGDVEEAIVMVKDHNEKGKDYVSGSLRKGKGVIL